MPLQEYIVSLVAKRIHHTLSLLARQTNQAQLDALQKYTKLINESVSTPVRIHTVQPGDNLYRIGRLYGIPWQELAHRNNLSDPDKIVAGQRLYVSEPLSLQEDLESVQMLWQERPFIPQPGFSSAKAQAQIVGTIIREAMKRWLEGDANAAKEAIKQLSDFSKAPVAMSVDADEPGENTVESDSFIELIKAMDHTELMGLTFTDVDYAQTNFVTITRGLQNYKVLAQTWLTWQTGTPKRVRAVSTTDTLTADQVVVIKASQEWRMSSDWWSSARNGVPKLIRDA
jgi:LysM repeat protein